MGVQSPTSKLGTGLGITGSLHFRPSDIVVPQTVGTIGTKTIIGGEKMFPAFNKAGIKLGIIVSRFCLLANNFPGIVIH